MTPNEINAAFERAQPYEYGALARRILTYEAPMRDEGLENQRTALRIFSAFDELDWYLFATYPNHERHDT